MCGIIRGMAKKMTSYRIEEEVSQRLAVLAALTNRSQAGVIENLVNASWEQRFSDTGDPLKHANA